MMPRYDVTPLGGSVASPSAAGYDVTPPQGVIFDGVSTKPMFYRGASRGQDSVIPSCDSFLGLATVFPDNAYVPGSPYM